MGRQVSGRAYPREMNMLMDDAVTTTSSQTYEIMTRSICATSVSSLPCYVCAFGLPTAADLVTVTVVCSYVHLSCRSVSHAYPIPQTSNAARPDPEPTLAVQQCATCERAVVRMAVEGHTPGTECLGCAPSTSDYPSTAMLTLSDVETISIGSYSLGSYPAASNPTGIATSTGYEVSNGPGSMPGPIITPTPFASAPEPSSNQLYSPPPVNATYVTAGSARRNARGAVLGFVALIMMVMLAQ